MILQERFLMNRNRTGANESHEFYWIPIHVMTPGYKTLSTNYVTFKRRIWLGPEPQTMFINSIEEWFIVNYNQTGFYRVNYDTNSWRRLIDQLNTPQFESIDVLNRAQIVDDLFNLARAKYVKYELLMDASMYLKRESNHIPWRAFFNGMSYVYERFEGQRYQKDLANYIANLTSDMYDKLGFGDKNRDEYMDELQRDMILQWACKVDKPECIEEAITYFTLWRERILIR